MIIINSTVESVLWNFSQGEFFFFKAVSCSGYGGRGGGGPRSGKGSGLVRMSRDSVCESRCAAMGSGFAERRA